MPKLTQKEAIQLLAAAGVPAVEIVDEGSEYNLDTHLSSIDQERGKIIRPQVEADITEKVKSEYAGRAAGTVRSVLVRNFPVERKELDGLNDDDMIKLALSKHDEKFSKDTEQLRNELTEQQKAFATRETTLKAEKEQVQSEWKDKYFSREVRDAILKNLDNAPLPKSVNKLEISDMLMKMAKDQAHLVLNEKTGEIEPRTKENTEMPIYNEAKTSTVKLSDLIQGSLKKLGLWETDMRNQNPAEAMNKAPQSEYRPANNNTATAKDFNSEAVARLEAIQNA